MECGWRAEKNVSENRRSKNTGRFGAVNQQIMISEKVVDRKTGKGVSLERREISIPARYGPNLKLPGENTGIFVWMTAGEIKQDGDLP